MKSGDNSSDQQLWKLERWKLVLKEWAVRCSGLSVRFEDEVSVWGMRDEVRKGCSIWWQLRCKNDMKMFSWNILIKTVDISDFIILFFFSSSSNFESEINLNLLKVLIDILILIRTLRTWWGNVLKSGVFRPTFSDVVMMEDADLRIWDVSPNSSF